MDVLLPKISLSKTAEQSAEQSVFTLDLYIKHWIIKSRQLKGSRERHLHVTREGISCTPWKDTGHDACGGALPTALWWFLRSVDLQLQQSFASFSWKTGRTKGFHRREMQIIPFLSSFKYGWFSTRERVALKITREAVAPAGSAPYSFHTRGKPMVLFPPLSFGIFLLFQLHAIS